MFRRKPPPEQPAALPEQDDSYQPNRLQPRSPAEALKPTMAPPPPDKPERERGGMIGVVSGALTFAVVLGLVAMMAVTVFQRETASPGPLDVEKVVVIPPKSSTGEIAEILKREGVIGNTSMFEIASRISGKVARRGEYVFKPHASIKDTIEMLSSGRQIQHAITFPEGLTSEQMIGRLRDNAILTGDVAEVPEEGALLPDTYKFERGATRQQIVSLMRNKQKEVLNGIWSRRSPEVPVKSPAEMVTLASIVEKETGRADERPRVAGVFVNRLKKRMRLQSDPTIVYGLVGGKGTLGRGITRSEIDKATPYNTYTIDGLPPGPIANPGRAALEAVANPSRTKDLYFVADGNGGHAFAETLDVHQRNVTRWRQVERARQQAQPSDPSSVDKVDPLASEPSAAPAPAARPGRSTVADPDTGYAAFSGGGAPADVGTPGDAVAEAGGARRSRAFDASEGTRLDPLRNRSYDLSTPKTVPKLRNP